MSDKKEWPRTVKEGHASVKIYREAHHGTASGWIYVLAWNTPMGRKREKFADQSEALSEARLKAGQLSAGRIEGASMSQGDRDEVVAARKLTGSVPVLAALQEWAKARALTGGNILPAAEAWAARNGRNFKRSTVAVVVTAYTKAKTAAKKKIADYHGSTLDRIKADFGDKMIDAVSASQLNTWLAKWDNAVTRNTYRRRTVAVWRWAQANGHLAREVTTEAEKTDSAHESAPEIGIINVATWRKLLTHFHASHADLLPALALAGFCGLRRSEIHAQVWEDVNLERKFVRVTQGKRGTPSRRMVPLSDTAVEWLMLATIRKGPICPTVTYKGKEQTALAIDGIRRIAKEATEGEKPKFPSLPENCFRHSYISHAVAATGDIPRVSLDAGNSPKEINRHYRELVSEAEGKAWFDSAPGVMGEVLPMGKAAGE